MKKVEAIIRPETMLRVEQSLEERGFGGFTLADVRGPGNQAAERGTWRGEDFELHVVHKILISVLGEDEEASIVVETILGTARTGAEGDGIVTVSDVAAVFITRTGERVSTRSSSCLRSSPVTAAGC